MIKIVLTIAFVSFYTIAAMNPLVKSRSNSKIIDVGFVGKESVSSPQYAPRIWAAIPGVYVPYEMINMTGRTFSGKEQCIIDVFGRESCPLLAQKCNANVTYSAGNSQLITTKTKTTATCQAGTSIYDDKTCRRYDVCSNIPGAAYDTVLKQCVSTPEDTYLTTTQRKIKYWTGWDKFNLSLSDPRKYAIATSSYSFKFYAKTAGTYTMKVMGDDRAKGRILPNYFVGNGDNQNNLISVPYVLTAGEHTIQFYSQDLQGGVTWVGALIEDPTGEVIWNSRTGQVFCSQGELTGSQCSVSPSCFENAPSLGDGYCFSQPKCETGFIQNAQDVLECSQNYSYYNYSCAADYNSYGFTWQGPKEKGLDCLGACVGGRTENCICNAVNPPADNCSMQSLSCPTDSSQLCTNANSDALTKKPLETHEVTSEGLVAAAFGEYTELSCGSDCMFGINKIYSKNGSLCFGKKQGQDSCSKVDGCIFDGSISASNGEWIGSIQTDGTASSIIAYSNTGALLPEQIKSSCKLNGTVGYAGRKNPITSIKPEKERLLFWNKYEKEGYLGFLEATRQVAEADTTKGYLPEINKAWEIREYGFSRIEAAGTTTYAISGEAMPQSSCTLLAKKYGFYEIPSVQGTPTKGGIRIDELINNAVGKNCNTDADNNCINVNVCDLPFYWNAPSQKCEKTEGGWFKSAVPQQSVISNRGDIEYENGKLRERWGTDVGAWIYLSSAENQQSSISGRGHIEYENGRLRERWGTDAGAWIDLSNSAFQRTVISSRGDKEYEDGKLREAWNSTRGDWITLCEQSMVLNPSCSNGRYDPATRKCLNGSNPIWRCHTVVSQDPQCPKGSTLDRFSGKCVGDKRCVLSKEDGQRRDFMASSFAIKKTNEQKNEYICSPLVCAGDHSCQYNECPDGSDANMIAQGYEYPKPNECIDTVCDANLPYYHWCSQKAPCPVEQPGVVQNESGCMHLECVDGNYDSKTGKCYQWKCPDGYTEEGAKCVKK